MQEIGAIGKEHDLEINCIPNNMEKYVAFMLGKHLVFMDSFQFTADSLEQLADNLPVDKFKYTSQVFQDKELALMKKKGVYPHDYMDSFQNFGYQQLPPKDSFLKFKICDNRQHFMNIIIKDTMSIPEQYEMMEKIQMITSGEEAVVKFPTSEELIHYTTKQLNTSYLLAQLT